MLLSFVVPVAPYHLHLVERARVQVENQTIPCAFVPFIDTERKGAGYARNRGVEQVSTPFISFLDADDYLDPMFAEKMLSAYKPGHYVYCDFLMAGQTVRMADCSNLRDDDAHHLINCVMHRDIFWQVGGFDENRNLEDTRFWAKCLHYGVCGIRCPEALVEYTGDGQRSSLARQTEGWIRDFWDIFRKEYPSMCGCNGVRKMADMGTRYDGDVLVIATWGGNRSVRGRITQRPYPRTGNYQELWMDKRDAEAQPTMFQIVPEPVKPEPDIDIIKELTAARLSKVASNESKAEPEPQPARVDSNSVQPTAQSNRQASSPKRKATRKPSSSNRRAG